ncbi:MAG: class I SAM-dependent methyltransferase, partial [Acaryochloridaceae cyanobacterium SU_2_1]|nr:class I SAM-dependent methyltransferase [Acaryochloridaceae cyanobacterium SU_2_1]
VINTERATILDAGCGSGYKSLVLAEANPGATIVGIDLSAESVSLAKTRLKHHGFDNAQFHTLAIEDIPRLGMEFDYINCDEVLYLFPNPADGLASLKSALKPQGIIRSNLHSSWQRAPYFRAQNVFQMMGLFENNPEALEVELVQEIMKALKPGTDLKARAWTADCEAEDAQETILMNYLFQGDQGFTIRQMFEAIQSANLEFLSMVNWRQWEVLNLFENPEDLPVFLALSLPEISVEERLTLFELLHPVHRLLDFWCTSPDQEHHLFPVEAWSSEDWQRAKVHLHPQLQTQAAKTAFLKSLQTQQPLDLSKLLSMTTTSSFFVDSAVLPSLLLLVEGPRSFQDLVEHRLRLFPHDWVTGTAMTMTKAAEELQVLLSRLEVFLYVLLELES